MFICELGKAEPQVVKIMKGQVVEAKKVQASDFEEGFAVALGLAMNGFGTAAADAAKAMQEMVKAVGVPEHLIRGSQPKEQQPKPPNLRGGRRSVEL